MKTLILVVVLACCALDSVTSYSDCGSVAGSVTGLSIPGCDNKERCILKRGTNATIEIDFQTNVDSNVLTAVVHGIVLNIPMPFNLPNPDGCSNSGIQCPISQGQSYKYLAALPVLNEYPKVSVDVKWELQDKDKKDIICVLIPTKIQ